MSLQAYKKVKSLNPTFKLYLMQQFYILQFSIIASDTHTDKAIYTMCTTAYMIMAH